MVTSGLNPETIDKYRQVSKTAERRTAKLRANDNAISVWAIIGNFTFELIVHIKWMITRLTVP